MVAFLMVSIGKYKMASKMAAKVKNPNLRVLLFSSTVKYSLIHYEYAVWASNNQCFYFTLYVLGLCLWLCLRLPEKETVLCLIFLLIDQYVNFLNFCHKSLAVHGTTTQQNCILLAV